MSGIPGPEPVGELTAVQLAYQDLSESGKHLGEALLANAFMDLKESNLRMVEVTVHPSNYKALRVYREELDFHVINVSDEDQMEEEEFLILRKTL